MDGEKQGVPRSEDTAGRLDCINVTQLVAIGPIRVLSIIYAATAAASSASFYNGKNTDSVMKIRMSQALAVGQSIVFDRPPIFDKGLYIVVNAATTYITVQWEPVEYSSGKIVG
jgi:hypothetical protein